MLTNNEFCRDHRFHLPNLAGYSLHELEQRAIRDTLKALDGNVTHAAKMLGVSTRNIQRKMVEYGMRQKGPCRQNGDYGQYTGSPEKRRRLKTKLRAAGS